MKVIVMGRNYTSRLGMIRAAGEAGCEVAVVRIMNAANQEEYDKSSKYVKGYYMVEEGKKEEILHTLEKIAENSYEKMIILPTDDNSASLIDSNQDRLQQRFLFPNIRHQENEVIKCMDKYYQKKLAKEAGLPVASGWTVSINDGKYTIPSDVAFPCFIKPQISIRGAKQIMKKCGSKEELEQLLNDLAFEQGKKGKHWDLLIEQYINIEKEYDIPGFAQEENVVMPAFIEKGIIYRGVTGTGKIKHSEQFKSIRDSIVRMIQALHFVGLFDLELYESNGTIYFNELNMRFGASGFAMTGSGINLPKLLIDALQGYPYSGKSVEFKEDRTFASEKVCFQAYRNNKISWKEFKNTLNNADFCFLKSEDDPGPYRSFMNYTNRYHVKKALKDSLRVMIRRKK